MSDFDLLFDDEKEELIKQPRVSIDTSSGEAAFDEYAAEAEKTTGVPFNLLKAVAKHESGFNPAAKAKTSSAFGYMQLIDGTARELGVDKQDPRQNVLGGAMYLKAMLDANDGDVERALASYFKGPGYVAKHGIDDEDTTGGTTARKYVDSILSHQSKFQQFDDSLKFEDEDSITAPPPPQEEQKFEAGGEILGPAVATLKSIPRGILNIIRSYQGAKEEALSTVPKKLESDVSALKEYLDKGASEFESPKVSDPILADIEAGIRGTGKSKSEVIQDMIVSLEGSKKDLSKQLNDATKWKNIATHAVEEGITKNKPIDPAETAVGRFAQDLVGGGTQILSAMASGPAAPVALSSMIAGGTIENALEKGSNYENAFKAGIFNTLIQMPLEMIGLGKIASKIPAGKVAKELLEKGGTEAVTEFLQQYPDEISVLLASKKGSSKEKLDAVADDMWEITKNGFRAAAIGGLLGAGIGGVQARADVALQKGKTDPDVVQQDDAIDLTQQEQIEKTPQEYAAEFNAIEDEDLQLRFLENAVPQEMQDDVQRLIQAPESTIETTDDTKVPKLSDEQIDTFLDALDNDSKLELEDRFKTMEKLLTEGPTEARKVTTEMIDSFVENVDILSEDQKAEAADRAKFLLEKGALDAKEVKETKEPVKKRLPEEEATPERKDRVDTKEKKSLIQKVVRPENKELSRIGSKLNSRFGTTTPKAGNIGANTKGNPDMLYFDIKTPDGERETTGFDTAGMKENEIVKKASEVIGTAKKRHETNFIKDKLSKNEKVDVEKVVDLFEWKKDDFVSSKERQSHRTKIGREVKNFLKAGMIENPSLLTSVLEKKTMEDVHKLAVKAQLTTTEDIRPSLEKVKGTKANIKKQVVDLFGEGNVKFTPETQNLLTQSLTVGKQTPREVLTSTTDEKGNLVKSKFDKFFKVEKVSGEEIVTIKSQKAFDELYKGVKTKQLDEAIDVKEIEQEEETLIDTVPIKELKATRSNFSNLGAKGFLELSKEEGSKFKSLLSSGLKGETKKLEDIIEINESDKEVLFSVKNKKAFDEIYDIGTIARESLKQDPDIQFLKTDELDTKDVSPQKIHNAIKSIVGTVGGKVDLEIVDQVVFKGEEIKLAGEGSDTKAFLTRDPKTGTNKIFFSSDLKNKEGFIVAALHEVAHIKKNQIEQNDKKLYQELTDAFNGVIEDSDIVRELEGRYKSDLDALKTEDEKYEFLFNEWVATQAQEGISKYVDEKGNLVNNTPNVFQKIWRYIKETISNILGKTTPDDVVNRAVRSYFEKLTPQKTDIKLVTGGEFSPTTEVFNEFQRQAKGDVTKQKTDQERYKTFAADKAALSTASTKNFKQRSFNFILNQFSGSKNKSYRDQLFQTIDKIKEPSNKDTNYNKLLELIDEFELYNNTSNIYNIYNKTKKNNKDIISKSNIFSKDIINKQKELDILENNFNDYITLKRLLDRGKVLKPFKKGTLEPTTPSERYKRALDNNYIKIIEEEGNQYYIITGKGRQHLSEIKDTPNQIEDLEEKVNELRAASKEARQFLQEKRDKRKSAKDQAVDEMTAAIAEKGPKGKAKKEGTKKTLWRNQLMRTFAKASLGTERIELTLRYLDGLEEGAFTKNIWENVDQGRNAKLKHNQHMTKYLKSLVEKSGIDEKKYSDIVFNNKVLDRTYKFDNNGNPKNATLNSAQKISLKMFAENENASRHLLQGGFKINPSDPLVKIKIEELNNIKLSKNEEIVKDVMTKYFEEQGRRINEVSNADVGYNLAGEVNYHPLRVLDTAIDEEVKDVNSVEDMRKKMFGFRNPNVLTKRKRSKAPLLLEGVFDAEMRTSNLIADYVGKAIPYKKIDAILKDSKFKTMMTESGHDLELREIQKFYNFAVGNDKVNTPEALRKINSIYTRAKLGLNPKVAMAQPMSAALYLSHLPKDVPFSQAVKFISKMPSSLWEAKRIDALIEKHSPFLTERKEGMIDMAIGEMLSGDRKAQKRQKYHDNRNAFDKLYHDGPMFLIHGFDMAAIRALWTVSEQEMLYKGMKKTDPKFYPEVAKRANFLVRNTQPTFDPIDRARIARSDKPLFQQMVKFSSQRMKNFELLKEGISEIKKGKPRGWAKLFDVVATQVIMFYGLSTAWNVLRGKLDPEDLEEGETLIRGIGSAIVSNIPVVGGMISDIIHGYDTDLAGAYDAVLTDLTKVMHKISKGKSPNEKDIERLIGNVLPITGPTQTLEVIKNIAEQ